MNRWWRISGSAVVVVMVILAVWWWWPSTATRTAQEVATDCPPPAATKLKATPATARKQETKTVVEGKKTQASVTSSVATTTTASGETAPVCSGQCQSTAVIVKSRGVEVPVAPDCVKGSQCQSTTVIVNSPSPATPVPALPAPPAAVPQRPAATTAPFEIIVSLVSWSEALRPAVANGRVDGRAIAPLMNGGQVARFGSVVDLDVVKNDGQVISLRTKLGQRGAMAVNEAVITMPRAEAANFGISNIVPKGGGSFILPQDRFGQSEIASSAARGGRGIIYFLVAAPPAAARSVPPPPPPSVPPQS